jgi:hypothetical protein
MVHERALEPVFGKPVKEKGFSEIPGNLSVTCALVNLHGIGPTLQISRAAFCAG